MAVDTDLWAAGHELGMLEAELVREPERPPFRPIREGNRAPAMAVAARYGYVAEVLPADGSGWALLLLRIDEDAAAPTR